MAAESTARQEASSSGLRQRMHFLAGQAQSRMSQIKTEHPPSPSGSHADEMQSSITYEDDSDSGSGAEDDEEDVSAEREEQSPSAPSPPPPPPRAPRPERKRTISSSELQTSGAWYEDVALWPVLISGVGSFFTGGDLLQNLLLLMFLIYYLHQIKEVPWNLYHSSRPRQRAPNHPDAQPTAEDERYLLLAESELYKFELLFLSLTLVSPFAGAWLLRTVSGVIMGGEPLSWFSTCLFMLAVGMRPWSHLISRMRDRVEDLHDVVHYPNASPSPDSSPAKAENAQLRKEIDDLKSRLEDVEKSLSKIKRKLNTTVDEMYDYVDETVDPLVKSVKRVDKKVDQRVKEVEEKMSKGKGRPGVFINTSGSSDGYMWILKAVLPSWFVPSSPSSRSPTGRHSPTTRYPHIRPHSHSASSSERLETIPEEPLLQHNRRTIREQQPKASLTSRLLYPLVYLATLPLRILTWLLF